MPATFTIPLVDVIPGQVITATLWDNEFENIDSNFIPAGMDDYSATDSEMQTAVDPFPSGTSRPTSLAGELERIRYILDLIVGDSYWYNHPAIDLKTLSTSTPVIPAGTVMIFSQPAVPTGWTLKTNEDERFLQLRTTAGGDGIGGTWLPSTAIPLAHSHTVNSHTHDLGSHTHTMGNHTHVGGAHDHAVLRDGWGSSAGSVSGRLSVSSNPQATGNTNTGSGGTVASGGPSTNTSDGPSTNTSGGTAPGTDSQLTDISLRYINVIRGTKD